ncbi:hypothetical protein QUA20_00370 [Microcoleus sp. Pol7_A1]|uniref:hypothetical protein n=1 Tax=Microcoleus sp. Pol7_A1 TaxID=2818893 RepID=UPI002FD4BB0C
MRLRRQKTGIIASRSTVGASIVSIYTRNYFLQSGVDSPVDRPLNACHRWYYEFSFGNWDVEGRRKKDLVI